MTNNIVHANKNNVTGAANDPLEELVEAAWEQVLEDTDDTQAKLEKILAATDWAAYRLVKKEELERLVRAAADAYNRSEGLWPTRGEFYEALQPFKEEEDERLIADS